eukprot:GHVS01072682.1.p1 GENE.GHVS01072682.1~~GHVS01072682.1.p1  ORF type:complete len:325 (-),score=57.50 GHVS01072682.1:81-1055(-)
MMESNGDSFCHLRSVIMGRVSELKDLTCLRAETDTQQMRDAAAELRRSLEKVDNRIRGLTQQLHTDQPLLEQIESTLCVTKQQYNNTNQLLAIGSRVLQHRFSPPIPSATILSPPAVHTAARTSVRTAGTLLTTHDLSVSSFSHDTPSTPVTGTHQSLGRASLRPSSALSVSQPPTRIARSKVNGCTYSGGKLLRYICQVPIIPKVSDADMERLPSHQRRGINCEKVNRAIDDIQTYLNKKHKIMCCASSRLTPEQYRQQKLYKEQETTATKNHVTFSVADLKQFEFLRNDTTSKCILTALRSMGRLDALTGAGQVLYGLAISR